MISFLSGTSRLQASSGNASLIYGLRQTDCRMILRIACAVFAASDAMSAATSHRVCVAQQIDLNGKSELSDTDAQELANKDWNRLFLADVTTISDVAIALLAKHKGDLILRALPDVSLRAAQSLSEHDGMLNIGGKTLSDEVIALLSRNKGELGLNSLTTLTPQAAASLAEHHAGVLGLNGLTTISSTAAQALAAHKGTLGLAGIESLSPEAAAGLAMCTGRVALPDRTEFSEEVRRHLSGHYGRVTLSSVDLPQYFPPDVAWQAESNSGVAARITQLIDEALKHALGPESQTDGVFTLSGVHVGQHLRELHNVDIIPNIFEFNPTRLLVPAPEDRGNPHPQFPVCVQVDSLNGNAVCVEKIFPNRTFAAIEGSVRDTFGATPQSIEEHKMRSNVSVRTQTALRWTFPKELVRVSQFDTVGGANIHAVTIAICSRTWAEENLRRYSNALLTACEWARSAAAAFDGNEFDVTRIPLLPGTEKRAELKNTHALFTDVRRARLLSNSVVVNAEARRGAAVLTSPYVAAVGKVKGTPVIFVNPFRSTVAGIRQLATLDQFGNEPDIRSTHAGDLIKHVASYLAQAEFPPATEQITVFREDAVFPDGLKVVATGGVPELNDLFLRTSLRSRYEWPWENGWSVRVSHGGALCLFREP